MTKTLLILTALFAIAGGASAQAGSLGGSIQVSLTVVPKCAVSSASAQVETRCTAGESAQVQQTRESASDTTYVASAEGQDAHDVMVVSF